MRRVKGADTTPEVVFRKALWAAGLRFRKHRGDLPGKPDIVFASRRMAVFVDGDYWHGNQWRRRGLACLEAQFRGTRSRDYWLRKIRRNGLRDCRATAELLELGWTVLRFWESDLRERLAECVEATVRAFREEAPDCSPLRARLPRKTMAFPSGEGPPGLAHEGWGPAPGSADATLAVSSAPLKGTFGAALVLLDGPVGMLTRDQGRGLARVLRALRKSGHDADAFLLDAADFGGRRRRRLFAVGRRAEAFPPSAADLEGTPEPDPLRPAALLRRLGSRARLRRLPSPATTTPVDSMEQWIARHYLNPCIEEAIRGAALAP